MRKHCPFDSALHVSFNEELKAIATSTVSVEAVVSFNEELKDERKRFLSLH